MRCKCGSFVVFASTNGKRVKIVNEEIDVDLEDSVLGDFSSFCCGCCSSQDIEGIDAFLRKTRGENFGGIGKH